MLRDFFKEFKPDNRPWLMMGKGPSFEEKSNYDTSDFNTIGLNQVSREVKVDIAHVIDVDTLGEWLYENCKYLLMPYHPHMGYKPANWLTLEHLAEHHPIVKRFHQEGRLFGYNLSTWKYPKLNSPVIEAHNFSAEAVVNILDALGVNEIRTIGIDGGTHQAPCFQGKEQPYDKQWHTIRRTIQKPNGPLFGPLGVELPIRVFIGAGPKQLIPALVLKHSILRHATMSCEVTPMIDWVHPLPKDRINQPRTTFSFQRFMIPEKCDYKGHAIYMDSDMLVFGDVKEIWQSPIDGHELVTMRNDDVDKHRAKFSVFKVNCGVNWKAEDFISAMDEGRLTYEDLVFDFRISGTSLDGWNPDWNSLEEYTEGKTKLLHYTEMYNQPWLRNPNHPLGYLWFNELKLLCKHQPEVKDIVKDHVLKGWLLPKCYEVLNAPNQQTTTVCDSQAT